MSGMAIYARWTPPREVTRSFRPRSRAARGPTRRSLGRGGRRPRASGCRGSASRRWRRSRRRRDRAAPPRRPTPSRLGRPAAGARALLDREQPVVFATDSSTVVDVERAQACAGRRPRRRARRRRAARPRRARRARPCAIETIVRSAPSRATRGLAERHHLALGRRALDRVEALVLEEDAPGCRRGSPPSAAPSRRAGVDGATTLIPGMPWNQVPWFCECIAPKRPPAPTAERTTSGTLPCSFETYQYFAAWLTRRVHRQRHEVAEHDLEDRPQPGHGGAEGGAGERQLGDRGVEDAVVAEALLEARRDREHAARERRRPRRRRRPLVALHLLGDRVADRDPELERRSCRRRTPSPSLRGIGVRRGERRLDRLLELAPRPRLDASISSSRDARARAAARGRSSSGSRAFQRSTSLGGRYLAGSDFEWPRGGRSGTRAASARRRSGRGRPPRAPPRATANRSLPSTTSPGCRRRRARAAMSPPAVTSSIGVNSPYQVVLAHEHDRQLEHLGEVQALVEVGLVGRAVAEEGDRDARPGAAPRAPRRSPRRSMPPTIPKQPTRPCSRSTTFIEPGRPPQTRSRGRASPPPAPRRRCPWRARDRGRGRCRLT